MASIWGNIGEWLGFKNDNSTAGEERNYTQQQMEYNSAEAQKNRDFQERMSNTQYQRGAADLKAAGYNPALVTNGAAASTPSGATASASAGHPTGKDFSLTEVVKSVASIVADVATLGKASQAKTLANSAEKRAAWTHRANYRTFANGDRYDKTFGSS